MSGLRNLDLFGFFWCLCVAVGYLMFFLQGERVMREVGTPFSETGIVANWFFYSALTIAVTAALAVFYKPLLWGVIAIVVIRNGLFAFSAVAIAPDMIPGVELLRLAFTTALTVVGSYWVLNWRKDKSEYEAEKRLSEEFD